MKSLSIPLYPVILCGGSGTRLWPLSRTTLPKQFIPFGEKTLFEETLDRVSLLSDKSILVCNHEHRFLVGSVLQERAHSSKAYDKPFDCSKHKILLEPAPKNTALAIALSAFCAVEENKEAVLLVLPSDQRISPDEELKNAIEIVLPNTKSGIITFGIKPNTPHTGYGYIEQGEELADTLYRVKCFTEKPNVERAKTLLENNASWNSGIFLMRADMFLEELQAYRVDIYEFAQKLWASHYGDLDFIRFDENMFKEAPSESIDYAIMEHTNKALVSPINLEWHDLGSFSALHENTHKDKDNNALVGDIIASETKNSYIHANSSLVVVHGMDNVALIQTDDAVLVAPLDKTQNIKTLIAQMRKAHRKELDETPISHRPWGFYEVLINSERYQVKHITVKPKAMLSKQMHHHRSEHWVIVKGTALVLCGETEKLLSENESIYIPIGEIHRLTNPGQIPLEIIEIQTGSYLGEDDITRFEDVYNR